MEIILDPSVLPERTSSFLTYDNDIDLLYIQLVWDALFYYSCAFTVTQSISVC